jgi:hypothetical protein
MAVLLLLQLPAPSASDKVAPGHIAPLLPVIAAGCAMTVTVVVIEQPVPIE